MSERTGDGILRVGTAGWSVPARYAQEFPAEGTSLERYATKFGAAEINSSFHRPHRRATYARWTASVPENFRFAVKVPKTVTHERKLVGTRELLDRFAEEVAGLGEKLGVLLVQLPPSLAFEAPVAAAFFADMRQRFGSGVACEPRHRSWFAPEAAGLLAEHRVARVAADPPRVPEAGSLFVGEAGADTAAKLAYLRLHGSPRVYFSDYDAKALNHIRQRLDGSRNAGIETWCIFDNTAGGCALGNALDVAQVRP